MSPEPTLPVTTTPALPTARQKITRTFSELRCKVITPVSPYHLRNYVLLSVQKIKTNDYMKKIMLTIMVAALAGNAFALDRYELDQRIHALEGKFEAFQATPGKGIGPNTLKDARGIIL